MTSVPLSQQSASVGRPRDPELERRILQAALDVYIRAGWSGFSFDGVAKAASCGRSALYRRWSCRNDLLIAALRHYNDRLGELPESGTTRDQLIELTERMLTGYLERHGLAGIRMALEIDQNKILAAEWETLRQRRVAAINEIILRGIDRGELNPNTSPTKLLTALSGTVLAQALAAPHDRRTDMIANARRYAVEAVDYILFDHPGDVRDMSGRMAT